MVEVLCTLCGFSQQVREANALWIAVSPHYCPRPDCDGVMYRPTAEEPEEEPVPVRFNPESPEFRAPEEPEPNAQCVECGWLGMWVDCFWDPTSAGSRCPDCGVGDVSHLYRGTGGSPALPKPWAPSGKDWELFQVVMDAGLEAAALTGEDREHVARCWAALRDRRRLMELLTLMSKGKILYDVEPGRHAIQTMMASVSEWGVNMETGEYRLEGRVRGQSQAQMIHNDLSIEEPYVVVAAPLAAFEQARALTGITGKDDE